MSELCEIEIDKLNFILKNKCTQKYNIYFTDLE